MTATAEPPVVVDVVHDAGTTASTLAFPELRPAAATRRPALDVAVVVPLWAALLFALPERMVFAPLGAAGTPAGIVAWCIAAWWGLTRLVPRLACGGARQPLRQALYGLFAVLMVTYIVAVWRGLPPVEQRASDRFLLTLVGFAGVAVVIADGIRDRAQLDVLLRRFTLVGAGLGLIGLVEQFTGFAYADWVHVPGLDLNAELFLEGQRGLLDRIAGTSNHPIGYGVPLALLLPLAIHYVIVARPGAERQFRVIVAAVIAGAIPVSISRSAVVAGGVALLVVFAGWSPRRRVNAIGLGIAGLVVLQVAMPGQLVTLLGLFTDPDSDLSIQARSRDWETALDYITARPVFGLGPGTFLPDQYFQLDNQVLKSLLETGLVGTFAFAALFVTGWCLARGVARRAPDSATRDLGRVLAAMILGAGAVCLTFDTFSFSFYMGVLFVTFGAAGAAWRLVAPVPR